MFKREKNILPLEPTLRENSEKLGLHKYNTNDLDINLSVKKDRMTMKPVL